MAISTNVAHITFTRGDTVDHKITVKLTDETAKDITGGTVKYTVRSLSRSGTQVFQKTVGSGIALTDAPNGILTASFTGTETATLIPGQLYFYDCELTLTGKISTVQTGTWIVKEDVTI